MREPSPAQREYIDSLRLEAGLSRLQLGDICTTDDASAAIEFLFGKIPLRARTRQAIFASLRDTRSWDKEVLYEALGVESLAADSGVNEAVGQRAIRLLKGEVERQSVPLEPRSFVDQLAALADAEIEKMAASQPCGDRVFDLAPAPVVAPVQRLRGRIMSPFPVEKKAPHPLVVAALAMFPAARIQCVRGDVW